MSATDQQLAYRVRILPTQLERARARVRQLEAEAARYRMFDLIGKAGDSI